MTDRMNQIPRTSREGDHHLARRGDPNFSISQPYSSSGHAPNHGTTSTGTHLQQQMQSRHESLSRDLRHVTPNQAHHYRQQGQTASGHRDPEALRLPQMDNDLSGLTRDIQSVHVSSPPKHSHPISPPSHHSSPGRSIPRKPIYGEPDYPANQSSREHHPPSNHPLPVPPYTAREPDGMVTSKKGLPDLTGIVDLRNTVDTSVTERIAPAVVHERRHKDIRHVREENITRETHTHDVFHRVQPIIDVEVLPARHFVPAADGSLREVAEETLPGRVREKVRNWIVAETVSRIPSSTAVESLRGRPRQFTARSFVGTEGDFKRYVTADGVEHTETTWVHPPVLEEGARLTGQTVPIHFEDGVSVPSESRTHGRDSRTYGSRDHIPHHRGVHDKTLYGHGMHGHGPRGYNPHTQRDYDQRSHGHGVRGQNLHGQDSRSHRVHSHSTSGHGSDGYNPRNQFSHNQDPYSHDTRGRVNQTHTLGS